MKYLIGEKFPKIDLTTTEGNITLPNDYSNSWFVFFSHPADFTPICTTEFVGFNCRNEEFAALNTKLIGLSIDSITEHEQWKSWIKENLGEEINFPIIEDLDCKVAKTLGILREDHENTQTARSVIIVDGTGTIRLILEYPMELGRNVDEVLRAIKGLQMFDESKVMGPANWPNNEIIGDKVMVSPSRELSEEEAKELNLEQKSEWFRYGTLNK